MRRRISFAVRCTLAVSVSLASLASVGAPARADVREVSRRVFDQWKLAGADVQSIPARFVFDDETVLVPMPANHASSDGCTHVALIGARGMSFKAKLADASTDPLASEPGSRASSLAGVLELHRCDPSRPIRQIVVASEAGRGAIEVVVAHAPRSLLPPLTALIPERTGGALPPIPEAGSLPPLAPPEARADAAENRAKRDGATIALRAKTSAGLDGGGLGDLEIAEGCHRIELFAHDPRATNKAVRRFRLDLDAELRDGATDQVLARDRTEAPDARLDACVGTPTHVKIAFQGAPPGGGILMTHGTWPLPARLPPLWGPATRSKMARALLVRHVAIPSDDPVFLAQGSSGSTPVPVPVEVGGCYVAVVGVAHGHAKTLQLHAVVGARQSSDERGAADEAALAAFCVGAHETARIDVLARGSALGWGLAVFRVKSGVWEAGR